MNKTLRLLAPLALLLGGAHLAHAGAAPKASSANALGAHPDGTPSGVSTALEPATALPAPPPAAPAPFPPALGTPPAYGALDAPTEAAPPSLVEAAPASPWGVRPWAGSLATFAGPLPAALLALGVDAEYRRPGSALGLAFGVVAATGEDFLATNAHVDVRYLIRGLSPLVVPFISAGVGHTWGIPREKAKNKNTITGLGARTSLGFDFLASPRVIPGLQAAFEYGPRLLPSFGTLATVQLSLGVTFVL